jgi:hypothetical protein
MSDLTKYIQKVLMSIMYNKYHYINHGIHFYNKPILMILFSINSVQL